MIQRLLIRMAKALGLAPPAPRPLVRRDTSVIYQLIVFEKGSGADGAALQYVNVEGAVKMVWYGYLDEYLVAAIKQAFWDAGLSRGMPKV